LRRGPLEPRRPSNKAGSASSGISTTDIILTKYLSDDQSHPPLHSNARKKQFTEMLLSLFFLSIISPAVLALNIDLFTATAEELSYRLEAGQTSSVRLVEAYLAQIEAHNRHGLNLRAVINAAPRRLVLDQAALLDHERRVGRLRGRLHGVPILVKDNIATHPSLGMQTTAGSFALEGSIVPDDAGVIAKVILKSSLAFLAKNAYRRKAPTCRCDNYW